MKVSILVLGVLDRLPHFLSLLSGDWEPGGRADQPLAQVISVGHLIGVERPSLHRKRYEADSEESISNYLTSSHLTPQNDQENSNWQSQELKHYPDFSNRTMPGNRHEIETE
jgi:hypothetical protein